MILRRLTSLDFLELKTLLASQRTFFGVKIELFPQLLSPNVMRRLFVNLIEQRNELAIGAFEGKRLIGAILFRLVPEHALWVVRLVVIDEGLKGASKGIPGELFAEATTVAEANGYFASLFVVPAAHITKRNSWKIKAAEKYDYLDIVMVPAGELPTDLVHDKLLFQGAPFPIDAMVREGRLIGPSRGIRTPDLPGRSRLL